MINDLADLSPKNPHRFSDLREGKLTFPLWLKKSRPNITDIEIAIEVKQEVAKLHEVSINILSMFPECIAKRMLMYSINILESSGIYKDFV